MTNNKTKRIPISIEIDPVERAKYKQRRDYLYHNDPVYKKHVDEQHREYHNRVKDDPEYKLKLSEHRKKMLSDPVKKAKFIETQKKYYESHKPEIEYKQYVRLRSKELKKKLARQSKLSDELELRELDYNNE